MADTKGIPGTRPAGRTAADRVPPHVFFIVSAAFHYLGPAFAALLFGRVDVLGLAWLRIASAAAVFAAWRRPWRLLESMSRSDRLKLVQLGLVLAAMNALFYLAIARLPLGTVGAIEFLGPLVLAALGVRSPRNLVALGLAVGGVYLLTDIRIAGEPLGFVFAFANAGLFVAYVVLGHGIADRGGEGIDRLGLAMLAAIVWITPVGIVGALPALVDPRLLLAGIGVGICSSVIPYVTDQLAMARLPRSTFALLLSILPATAMVIGVLVLGQIPTTVEVLGVLLVVLGVAVHEEAEEPAP
jgi:inner membrane transporter RhtA